MIKNILFDLGGVLYHINYQKTISAFAKIGDEKFKANYSQFNQDKIFDEYETGVISTKEFVHQLQRMLPNSSSKEIIAAWNAMLIGMPKEKFEYIKELSKKYNLFLLSNTNKLHMQNVNKSIKEELGIEDIGSYFTKAYYSHEIKMRKPHVKTFKWVLTDANLKAEETLFVEDTIQHIEGAKKAGLKIHYFKSNSSFKDFDPDKAL
jgi:putative hydrolase of the HAD superfamily